jgi:hypothetical protein
VTTHVFAEELTEKAVLDAIRNARCRVVFEISGDPGQANSVKRVEKAYLNGEYVGTRDDLEKRIVPNQVFVSRLEYYREDGKPWILEAPRRPGRP